MIDDAALEREMIETVEALWPESFEAVHRVILTASRRQWDLNGFVIARAEGDLRLRATSSMAGTLFDAVRAGGHEPQMLSRSPRFRERWALEGALVDAEAIHLMRPSSSARLTRRPDGRAALTDDRADGGRADFIFDSNPLRLAEVALSRDGLLERRVTFRGERVFPGWPTPVPSDVTMLNSGLGYTLHVQLVALRSGPIPDERFHPEVIP